MIAVYWICWLLLLPYICTSEEDIGLELTEDGRSGDPCTETKNLYRLKGFTQSVPNIAIEGNDPRVCSRSPTCCTGAMEDQLSAQSVFDLETKVTEKSSFVKDLFAVRSNKFNLFFRELIANSRDSLDTLFKQTYEDLYTDNSKIFMDLFDELKLYYEGSALDMYDIFDDFFMTLMQQVFKLLNPSFDIDEEYLQCVADHIHIIKPFHDMPQKLSNQVHRAFIAARTFVEALQIGQQITTQISKIYPTTECAKALMKMSYCSRCHGIIDAKPCESMCLNVMKGCLCNLGETSINDVWNKYIESMMLLLDRLEGPFNIESVLDPIDVKISEAIMMLQDNERDITNTVFLHCGHLSRKTNLSSSFDSFSGFNFNLDFPVPYNPDDKDYENLGDVTDLSDIDFSQLLGVPNDGNDQLSLVGKRSISEEMTDGQIKKKHKIREKKRKRRRRKRKRNRRHRARDLKNTGTNNMRPLLMSGERFRASHVNPTQTRLEVLVAEMRLTANEAKNFWRNMPVFICKDESEQIEQEECWNGVIVGKYTSEVVKDGVMNQIYNPEVLVNVTRGPDMIIRQQIAVINEITLKLQHAYRGINSDQVDAGGNDQYLEGEEDIESTSGDYFDEPEEVEHGKQESKYDSDTMPFNMEETDGLNVKDLEMWQIKLVEQVLGENVAPSTSLTEIRERLAQHPNLNNETIDSEQKKRRKDRVFGDLSESRQRKIEERLGITVDPSKEMNEVRDMLKKEKIQRPPPTAIIIEITTTGCTSCIKPSFSFIFFASITSFISIVNSFVP